MNITVVLSVYKGMSSLTGVGNGILAQLIAPQRKAETIPQGEIIANGSGHCLRPPNLTPAERERAGQRLKDRAEHVDVRIHKCTYVCTRTRTR